MDLNYVKIDRLIKSIESIWVNDWWTEWKSQWAHLAQRPGKIDNEWLNQGDSETLSESERDAR